MDARRSIAGIRGSLKSHFSAGLILVGGLALATNGCAADAASTDDQPAATEAPPTRIVRASRASTTALGVVAWQITMVDGTYSVAGFDDDMELKAGMQTQSQDGPDGALLTKVRVDIGDLHAMKYYSSKADQTVFAQDEITGNADAERALELMQNDIIAPDPSGADMQTSAITTLEGPTLADPTKQPGLAHGFEIYGSPQCDAADKKNKCVTILQQTNSDCQSSAFCSQNQAKYPRGCGGSAEQCRKDQAYVKSLGCDTACANKTCKPISSLQLTCEQAALKCSQTACNNNPAWEAGCRQYGAQCKDTETARGANGDGSFGSR